MLSRIAVRNFRSLENVEIALGPITVLFGPTSAGKSSIFYSLLALRNFVLNPNQATDGFFNLGFQNLGGFDACVFNHVLSKSIGVTAEFSESGVAGSYAANIGRTDAHLSSRLGGLELSGKVNIPYGVNQNWSQEVTVGATELVINWNGIASTVSPKTPTGESLAEAVRLAEKMNQPVELLKRVDICPHRRGFFKPSYSPVSLGSTPTSEDEVASLIINDPHSPARISVDMGEIFGRDFRIYTPPGTATTFLQTTEVTGARVPGLLVNDGFGVNQVVYMLAKIHRPEVETVLIEEPEVHLHPTVVRNFAKALTRLVVEDGKQLVFTTHSEQFLLSLLACVKESKLEAKDLVCYHATRTAKATSFERQEVSHDGQIKGGLASFMSAELEDIKSFLGVSE